MPAAQTSIVFVDTAESWPLPKSFDLAGYFEAERELWALFPETDGRRANFVQAGCSAWLYASVIDDGSGLVNADETFVLLPCPDRHIRPVRMRAIRRLTLEEYRYAHLTAVKLIGRMNDALMVMDGIGREILGPEVCAEAEARHSCEEEEGD
jgi:hypothetical protein